MRKISYIVVESLPQLSDDELQLRLETVSAAGYDGVELNLTEPPGVDFDRLEQWLADAGLVIPSFMTGGAYQDGLCLSSPELSVRKKTVERLLGYLRTGRRFDAVLAIGLLQGFRSDEPDPEVANDRIVACLREVASAAEDEGVDLVLEPVNHLQVGFNNSVREVCDVVDRVGSPALHPMADTIHMNIEERSPLDTIRGLRGKLRHFHLCESNGALLGSGNIDFEAVWRALAEIDYERFVSVKVYRGARWDEAAQASIAFVDDLRSRTGYGTS
jgi:D-psicose/D-tagatose/L-ribulose 3-epimerase